MSADTIVVGMGSIGVRHARVLREAGRSVATVSRRGGADFQSLAEAIGGAKADYVVIATETSRHHDGLKALAAAGYEGRVLVEKPLFPSADRIPANNFRSLSVGYNVRFHPVLQRLRGAIAGQTALQAEIYVGQHLTEWRAGRDHTQTASARKEAGGGVIRDLSHELDYLMWILGPWTRLSCIIVNSGSLGIETEDAVSLLIECEDCPAVTLSLNYHHRPPTRRFTVDTTERAFCADLVGKTLSIDGRLEVFTVDPDLTYRAMHRAVLDDDPDVCTGDEGGRVVDLIVAAERAAVERRWIEA